VKGRKTEFVLSYKKCLQVIAESKNNKGEVILEEKAKE
jgi:hypothetical protein